MKKLHYAVVLFILIGCIPIFCTAGINENNKAIDSVRLFENDPKLDLNVCGYEHLSDADYFVIVDKNTEYWINAETNFVERYSCYDNLNNCDKTLIKLEEAQNIAESFLKDHDKQINLKDFSLVMNELIDGGDIVNYYFLWREYVGSIESPNLIFISINPASGEIIHYINIHRPITVSLENEITREKAEFMAIDQFTNIDISSVDSKLKVGYDEKGSQRLVWECLVVGQPKNFILQGGIIHIDAHSGEIIQTDYPM